jgi:hypothetical protein
MIRRTLCAVLLAVLLLAGGAAWYLFRPRRRSSTTWLMSPFRERYRRAWSPPRSPIIPRSVPEALGGSIPAFLSPVPFYVRRFAMLNRRTFAALALLVAGVLFSAGITQAQESGAKVLAKGEFHNADKAGKGTATVYQLADGKRVLRLSNFETDNGPDLHVRLIAADDARNTASVAKTDYVEVAKLKGNKGNQNYELPDKADLGKYRVVSIWCNRFTVNFAAAPLTAQ